jgi:hypothetical protein
MKCEVTDVQGVCVECGQACAVVVQEKRAVSACCGANALEDGGLFYVTGDKLADSERGDSR